MSSYIMTSMQSFDKNDKHIDSIHVIHDRIYIEKSSCSQFKISKNLITNIHVYKIHLHSNLYQICLV